MSSKNSAKRVRYAVVGAGWFGQAAVLPAFANAQENSELAAIVSGDPEKRSALSAQYGVPAYSYERYEELLASGAVDAVYIVSPNSIHREQAIQAARHGVHVLSEKPLADTAVAAEEMIAACDRAGVLLMTAYRLHFEPANLKAIELVRKGAIGEPRLVTAAFTQVVEEGNNRLKPELGGHPLLDVGIYCVNAARYLFRGEPVEVTAFNAAGPDPKFRGLPEMVAAVLRFPGERLATFVCGFGEAKASVCRVIGTKGDIRLEPAFTHAGKRTLFLTFDGETTDTDYPECDQIGPEIVYFSNCVLTGEPPEPDGREGLIDLRILDAIQTSAAKGVAVPLQPVRDKSRPGMDQQIDHPKVKEPELVHAAPPTGD